jgi:hypothetical protein
LTENYSHDPADKFEEALASIAKRPAVVKDFLWDIYRIS